MDGGDREPHSNASDGGHAAGSSGPGRWPRLGRVLDWLVHAESVLALAALLAAPVVALGAAAYAWLNSSPDLALAFLMVSAQVTTIILVVALLRRPARLSTAAAVGRAPGRPVGRGESQPTRSPSGDAYRMAAMHVAYSIDPADPRHHVMCSSETVVAERDGLTHIGTGFFWTGSGRQGAPVLTSEHDDVKILVADPDHPLEDFWIAFGGRGGLLAGERRAYAVRADFYDEGGSHRPYLRQLVDAPTDRLTLALMLPAPGFPAVTARVRKSKTDRWQPLDEQLVVHADLGLAFLTVDSPVLEAEYSLDWQRPVEARGAVETAVSATHDVGDRAH